MTPFLRRLIAGFQIVGAIFGLTVTALGALRIYGEGWASPVVELAALGFFGALGVAGVLLWRNDELGIRLSILAQIAQVPAVTTHLLTYRAQTPVSIDVSFDSVWNLGLNADIGSYFALVFGRDTAMGIVSVNLVAVACLVPLLRAGRSLTSA